MENKHLGTGGTLLSLPVSFTPEQTHAINDFLKGYADYDPRRYGILAAWSKSEDLNHTYHFGYKILRFRHKCLMLQY